MKKIFFSMLLMGMQYSMQAQIKIFNKRIDGLPEQPKDFRVMLDAMYKNLVDSSVSEFKKSSRTRTAMVLEYGDGSFTDTYNSDHGFARSEGQNVMSVITTYYDTVDKPRSSVRLMKPGIETTETVAENHNLAAGRFIDILPYSRRNILFSNTTHKPKDTFFAVIPYRNIKGLIAIYYNETSDTYFKEITTADNKMFIKDLNTTDAADGKSLSLVRTYQNQEVFYNFSLLTQRFPGYISKTAYIRKPENFKHVVYVRINTEDSTEQNIFLSLKPQGGAGFSVSGDSTTSVLVRFFSDNTLFLGNQTPGNYLKFMGSLGYAAATDQRVSLSARDPNFLQVTSPLGCLLDIQQSISYFLTFYNDGAGAATEIRARFTFNSKVDITSIRNITVRLDTNIYVNPVRHDAATPRNNTDRFYYQQVLSTKTGPHGILVTTPCIEIVIKDVALRGTYHLPFNELGHRNKGTISFNGFTKPIGFDAEATADVYFNGDPLPVTATNTKERCPPPG